MKRSFPEETRLTNRYQWDVEFPDGDIYKKGVGGQGLYISAVREVIVAYCCSGDGAGYRSTNGDRKTVIEANVEQRTLSRHSSRPETGIEFSLFYLPGTVACALNHL